MALPRIVITGLGGICGLGVDVPSIWQSLVAGRSAIGPITIAPLHELKVRIGAEIKQMPDLGFDRRRLVTMDRFSLIAVIAAGEALRHAGIVVTPKPTPARIGAIIGTGIFGAETVEDNYRGLFVGEADARRRLLRAARHAKRAGRPGQHGARPARPGVRRHLGLLLVQPRHRLGRRPAAARPRRHHAGRRHRRAAGLRHPQGLGSAARGRPRNLPAVLGRPRRAGARRRRRRGRARNLRARGRARRADPCRARRRRHVRRCLRHRRADGRGSGRRRCRPALPMPASRPKTSTTSTRMEPAPNINDVLETQAIRRVFGKHADALSVSSTKSMHAHCMGASGALELIACVMAIRDGIVPPTANYREKDPECDLDVTPNVARQRKVRVGDEQRLRLRRHQCGRCGQADLIASRLASAMIFRALPLMRGGRAPKCRATSLPQSLDPANIARSEPDGRPFRLPDHRPLAGQEP